MGQGLEWTNLKTPCATHNSSCKVMDSNGEYVMGCNWMKTTKIASQPRTLFILDWELWTLNCKKKDYKH
jgi:hypothetical protein